MSVLFAETALLPSGWARNVRFEIDAAGQFTAITPDASAEGAERIAGPVLAGMPNLHSHAFQRAMAGLAEVAGNPNDSFWTWRELMYRLVARLSPEQVEVIARQLYIEMLKAGYTGVAEFHYVHHDLDGQPYANPAELALRVSQAAADAGIGLTLLPVLYCHAGFGGQPPSEGQRRFINSTDSYLKLIDGLRTHLADQPQQGLGLCFHSLRAVTPQQITEVLGADSTTTCPVHIHIAEQQKEVDDCLAWSGRRPLQWLYENVAVDQRWCLVHATHAEPDEVTAMARSGAVAGLCLTTEANLGDGIFPGGGLPRPERPLGHRFGQPRLAQRGRGTALAGIRPAPARPAPQPPLRQGPAHGWPHPVRCRPQRRRTGAWPAHGGTGCRQSRRPAGARRRRPLPGQRPGRRHPQPLAVRRRRPPGARCDGCRADGVVREGRHALEEQSAQAFGGVLRELLD